MAKGSKALAIRIGFGVLAAALLSRDYKRYYSLNAKLTSRFRLLFFVLHGFRGLWVEVYAELFTCSTLNPKP